MLKFCNFTNLMKKFLLILILFIYNFTCFSQTDPKPNIVLIIADDMGWNQVSNSALTNNNPSDFFETPNIDLLASQGIAFPNGYVNGANCAPTRAAILSGQYAARPHNNVFTVYDLNRGNTASNSNLIGPYMGLASNDNIDEIPKSAITLAETLKITAGYKTAHFGKYHVGEYEDVNTSNNAPTDQGFDYNFGGGTDGGPGSQGGTGGYFARSLTEPYYFGDQIGPELDQYADPYSNNNLSIGYGVDLTGTAKHVTDAMVEAAFEFMDNHNDEPFFMHFSNFAIHGPFNPTDARPDYRAKYEDKANGPDDILGNDDDFEGLFNHESHPGQAALAEHMDQAIGRLVDYLKTTDDPRNPGNKLSANTLVYFVSDNGDAIKRSAAKQGQTPLRGMKGEYYEGGIRSVTFAWSEAPWLMNKGTVNLTPVVAFDLYPTFVEAAGGTLPSDIGTFSSFTGANEAAGGTLPSEYNIDGESQWQMLTNGASMPREALFWHHPGYLIDTKRDSRPVTVVRKGDYKLMHFYENSEYELYNLATDLNETTNLLPSADQIIIDIANDMISEMRDHLVNTNAPLPMYRSSTSTSVIDGDLVIDTPGIITPLPSPVVIMTSCGAIGSPDAFWNFDLTFGTDDSINSNNAFVTVGEMEYSTTDFKEGDRSFVFDGNSSIEYSDNANPGTFLRAPFSEKSFSAWIKPASHSGIQNIFDEGGSTKGIALRLNGSDLQLTVNAQGTDPALISSPLSDDGEWHHVAFIYDGGNNNLSLYIDGVIAASTTTVPTSVGNHNGSGIGAKIGGADSFGNTDDNFFKGKMDAVAVYDSAISGTQIEDAVKTFYFDGDSDNYANSKTLSCSNPGAGFTATVLPIGDCDDDINAINPDASEIADGRDNNCDGIVDEGITYVFDGSWSPANPNGFKTDASIIIQSGSAIIDSNTSCNAVTIEPGAGLIINSGVNLTTNDANNGLILESTSSSFSSLILNGGLSGVVKYERHVNSYTNDVLANDNDLISPPLNGQNLADFTNDNSGLILSQGSNPTVYAIAPFNNDSGNYENYDSDTELKLNSGQGYRIATNTPNTNLTFTGQPLNRPKSINILVGADVNSGSWNLIGNPYPSYVDFDTFHSQLISDGVLETGYVAIYGFDGDVSDGWTVWDGNNGNQIAPGQAFFVKTKLALNGADPSPSVTFEPSMRRVGSSDDFIVGRNETSFSAILKLNSNEGDFKTNLYFRSNATSGLDYGYDTAVFDSDNYDIFTNVIEGDSNLKLYNQALSFNDVYDVVVPLGIKATNGQSIVISLDETSSLPNNIYVYLEDTIENTFTSLSTGNYASYIDNSITGLGRYFLHFQTNTLSDSDAILNRINIYCIPKSKSLVIKGVLDHKTDLSIYDLQGRMVLNKELNTSIIYNEIDVNFLKQGIYIVKVNAGEYSKIKKVIID